jgi:hypothetical protein
MYNDFKFLLNLQNNQIEISQGKYPHSHPQPERRHISKEIQQSICTMGRNHSTVGEIQSNLSTQFPTLHIGSKRQIKHLKNTAFSIPSGNSSFFPTCMMIKYLFIILFFKEMKLQKLWKLEEGL